MCGMTMYRGLMFAVGFFILAKFAMRACSYGYARRCGGGWGGMGYGGYGGHPSRGGCGAPSGYGGDWGSSYDGGPHQGPYRSHGGPRGSHGHGEHGAAGGGQAGGFGFSGSELRDLATRLDLSTDQWMALRKAMRDMKAPLEPQVTELVLAQREAAAAFRGYAFDENTLGSATSRIEGAIDAGRKSMIAAFASVHAALDLRQRGIVADYLEHAAERAGRRAASRWF